MTANRRSARARIAIGAASLGLLAACSINPATGERQLALIGEQQEIALGKEAAQSALAQYGRYDDPELQQYVSSVGQELAAASERPDLPWSFTVVDDPTVNAFALPGGQIFVTRGILTHFNSEAELAAVLGHEIGHVTARHSVEQMSTAQLANLGLGVAMIASEDFRPYAGLASQGLQLMFLKFSRDDESQSDELGLRYMTRLGYDPHEMPKMFDTLARISAEHEGGRIPVWASTHPDPGNRSEQTYRRIEQLPPNERQGTVDRADYLRHIEGVVFGDDPRQGYFIDNRFYHPEMAFRLDFPNGWKTMNTRQFVAGVSPQEDAIVQLSLARADSAAQATDSFFASSGVERGSTWQGFHQFRTVPTQQQPTALRGLVGFIEHGGQVLRLVGYAPEGRWSAAQQTISSSLASFQRVTARRYLDVSPKRVDLVEVDRPMTLAEFDRRYPSTVDLTTLAIANGMQESTAIEPGTLVKRVVGGELPGS